jgi:hypothetical protein
MSHANPGTQLIQNDNFHGAPRSTPAYTGKGQVFTDSVKSLLGEDVKFTDATSVNLDTREGSAHSTTGIPYAISGTARVVSQRVGAHLTGYSDPIKSIMGVGVHRDARILIKRKYVVGGSATITPERAPARTCAIKEDVREVSLVRYGTDIEMNLNLMLIPGAAKEELEMKMDAQKSELSRSLTNIGYDTLMSEGTPIVDAIMRSNPSKGDLTAWRQTSHRVYSQQIFGAVRIFLFLCLLGWMVLVACANFLFLVCAHR